MSKNPICPYCEKKAQKSYGYPDMLLCKNKNCFYYMKDDIRNIDDFTPREGFLEIILSFKHVKNIKGFILLTLSDKILCDAMEKLDKLKISITRNPGLKVLTIPLEENEAQFFEYTSETDEMNEILNKEKYREIKNIKIRNFKMNKKLGTMLVNLLVMERGIRIQTKLDDNTYQTINSCLIPWDFFK